MAIRMRCGCADPGCPWCKGRCTRKAATTLYRVDMEDATGTPMCSRCAADAMESGVFTDTADVEGLDDDEGRP